MTGGNMASPSGTWLWCVLAVSRLIWALLPQTGYIHPDEFFQSVEIVAGDLFQLNVTRTWEFNQSFPVRSVVPIYIFVGLPLLLLRFLSQTFGMPLLSWYSVTVFVRGALALLSFVVDYSAYRLSTQFGQRPVEVLLVISSSFVALVFYSRPFSNTIESFLFALLLLITVSRDRPGRNARSRSAEPNTRLGDTNERVAVESAVVQSELLDAVLISFLVVLGVFNRPTFLVYAAVPCLFWVFRGPRWNVLTKCAALVVPRLSCLAVFGASFVAVFAVCDSIYFGWLPLDLASEVSMSEIVGVVCNLTLTPLNFILYNTRADNLAQHGVHPRFTHLFVNIPLLFGVLGLFFIVDMLRALWRRETRGRLNIFLMLTVSTPLVLLSAFPHQEPRFLIPLLLPICLMYASKVFGKKSQRSYLLLWAFGNLLCGLFFGVLHQGGVVRALGTMQRQRRSSTENSSVVFWHTYMPPTHLLLSPARTEESVTRDGSLFEVHDFAGRPFKDVIQFAKRVHDSREGKPVAITLVAPGSLHSEVTCTSCGFRLELVSSHWPHVSTEDLPRVSDLLCYTASGSCETTFDVIQKLVLVTSLNVYSFVFED